MSDPTCAEQIHRAVADSTFADLVCADPAWLRAEFDAIIAASFPTVPPPHDEAPCQGSPGRATGPAPGLPDHTAEPRPQARVRERWMRQRSPPRTHVAVSITQVNERQVMTEHGSNSQADEPFRTPPCPRRGAPRQPEKSPSTGTENLSRSLASMRPPLRRGGGEQGRSRR